MFYKDIVTIQYITWALYVASVCQLDVYKDIAVRYIYTSHMYMYSDKCVKDRKAYY